VLPQPLSVQLENLSLVAGRNLPAAPAPVMPHLEDAVETSPCQFAHGQRHQRCVIGHH
jgi:hypothetical protein